MRKDILREFDPHTPRLGELPDRNRPTCSQPAANNRGCDRWHVCRLPQRDSQSGPVQQVIIDHRDCSIDEGRRMVTWCFTAAKLYFGENPKAGYSVAADGIYIDTIGDKVTAQRLPPADKQGPFNYPGESAANPAHAALIQEALRGGNQKTNKP
jgi:hypothetical protein